MRGCACVFSSSTGDLVLINIIMLTLHTLEKACDYLCVCYELLKHSQAPVTCQAVIVAG